MAQTLNQAQRTSKFLRSGSPFVTVSNRDQFLKLDGVDKIVNDLIAKYYYAPDGSSLAQKELKRVDAVASGNLIYQGLLPTLSKTNKGYVIEFHLNRDTPYWKTIEKGLDKHKAFPLDNIELWITQKPTLQAKIPEFMKKFGIKKLKTARRSLAYLIASKIWNEGIRAKTDFFTKQHDPFLKELRSKLPKSMGDDLRLTILEGIKKK